MRPATPTATKVANATMGAAALQQAYDEQKRRNMIVASIVGGVALLVVLFFGLRAAGLLGASGSNPKDKLLVAKGDRPGPILSATGRTGSGVLEKPAQKPPDVTMPDDVYAWLKHLEKCEAMKVQIAGDQAAEVSLWMQKNSVLGAGMGMMNPYDQANDEKDQAPGEYTKGKVLDLRPKWEELLQYFRSVPPPAECKLIADDFDRATGEIPGMMGDIGDILNSADSDPTGAMQKAKKLQNGSYGDIDRYFLRCDEKVSQICQKYKVNKWFNVKGDVMAGGMMGKFSGLSGGGL